MSVLPVVFAFVLAANPELRAVRLTTLEQRTALRILTSPEVPEPQVVRTPFVAHRSLMATGMPCIGPRSRPTWSWRARFSTTPRRFNSASPSLVWRRAARMRFAERTPIPGTRNSVPYSAWFTSTGKCSG